MTASPTLENVDPQELQKFSALAARWWDPTSEFKPLHDINPLRIQYILEITGDLSGKKVLDVGCGGGLLSEGLAQQGASVTGIDLAEKSLQVAQLHRLESNLAIDYQKISVEELAKNQPNQFDVVCCLEMLEHVPDPASVVSACSQAAKPGGLIFFSTINRNLSAYLQAIIGAEYLLKLLPRGTHEYARFIKPSELAAWGRNANLSLKNLTGMRYNPITRTYTLTRNATVNYLISFIKD